MSKSRSLAIGVASIALFGCGSAHHESGTERHLPEAGRQVFIRAGCGGCHTLNAAGSKGTVGPNLDNVAGALTLAFVVHQVQIGGGPMPAFKTKLTAKQIQAVSQYVLSNAGK